LLHWEFIILGQPKRSIMFGQTTLNDDALLFMNLLGKKCLKGLNNYIICNLVWDFNLFIYLDLPVEVDIVLFD
jgi:hypothetical protein